MTRRRVRRILLAALLTGIAALVASILPFVRPTVNHPTEADAVVVLAGDYGDRLALGLRLVRAGLAPTLVLAGRPDFEEAERLCRASVPFEVVCIRPPDDSTRTEAQATAELARTRGWRHVVVVTSTAHVTRSRLLFRRCVDGRVDVVAATPPYGARSWVRVVAHEWLGAMHAVTVEREC